MKREPDWAGLLRRDAPPPPQPAAAAHTVELLRTLERMAAALDGR